MGKPKASERTRDVLAEIDRVNRDVENLRLKMAVERLEESACNEAECYDDDCDCTNMEDEWWCPTVNIPQLRAVTDAEDLEETMNHLPPWMVSPHLFNAEITIDDVNELLLWNHRYMTAEKLREEWRLKTLAAEGESRARNRYPILHPRRQPERYPTLVSRAAPDPYRIPGMGQRYAQSLSSLGPFRAAIAGMYHVTIRFAEVMND